MTERTAEVAESLLREYCVGWGESKMDLLENAGEDLASVSVLLTAVCNSIDQHDKESLANVAFEKLTNAIQRVEMCHNELDVEREMGPEFGHDSKQQRRGNGAVASKEGAK